MKFGKIVPIAVIAAVISSAPVAAADSVRAMNSASYSSLPAGARVGAPMTRANNFGKSPLETALAILLLAGGSYILYKLLKHNSHNGHSASA